MRKSRFFIGCCVLLLANSAALLATSPGETPLSQTPNQTPSQQIRWRTSLQQARQEARQTGKPVLLHFYTKDCVYCEKLENGAFRDPMLIAELEQKCVPVKVYAPDNGAATKSLSVDRFPTDVFVTADDGMVLERRVSPLDPYAYLAMLNSVHQDYHRIASSGSGINGNQPGSHQGMSPGLQAPQNPNSFAQPGSQPFNLQHPHQATLASSPQSAALPAQTYQGPTYQGPAPQIAPTQNPSPFGNSQAAIQPAPGQDFAQPGFAQPFQQPVERPTVSVESTVPMMEGYCLVTLVDDFQWKLGAPNIGAMHLGRLYLFANPQAREKFLQDPQRYAPVMNGLDVVKFFDEGKIVEGVRGKGCTTENPERLFFFSSEETLAKFEANEQSRAHYTKRAIELTQRAAAEANGR